MSKISFPDFRLECHQRKERHGSSHMKIKVWEHWSFVDEQLNSYFILTHGHIWYHLITHQFHVGSLTSLILPLHTNDLSREYKQLVNLNVQKLSVELQKLRLHLKLEEKMNEFKKMCENLFIYPPELTPSVPTPSNSSLVAPSSDTESTPVKKTERTNIHTAEHTFKNTTPKPSNHDKESKKMCI